MVATEPGPSLGLEAEHQAYPAARACWEGDRQRAQPALSQAGLPEWRRGLTSEQGDLRFRGGCRKTRLSHWA
jgi:hypothetical protein